MARALLPTWMMIGAMIGITLPLAAPVRAGNDVAASGPPAVVEHGGASYYNDRFQGRPTASGELHDQNAFTAASRDLPLGATATVTNLENGKSVEVEIIDRGPYRRGLVIDLSKRAANSIGIDGAQGVAQVRVEASASTQPTPELNEQVAAIGAKKRAARTAQAAPSQRR